MKKFTILSVSILSIAGCALVGGNSTETPRSYLAEGSILVSRPTPELRYAANDNKSRRALGLLPSIQAMSGNWLLLERATGLAKLMNGDNLTDSTPIDGASKLRPGSYSVVLKQRNPLWYAPDSYFTQRNLAVPAEGARERFLRGALGDYVMYLSKETPIHSGPIWSEDVGGVRIDDSLLAKFYYLLPVGAPIEIR